ncbi:MAG: polysaccharide biosynthesis/export family protein, partial [bacterium]
EAVVTMRGSSFKPAPRLRRFLCVALALAIPVQFVPVALSAATSNLPLVGSSVQRKYPPLLIGPGDLLDVTVFGQDPKMLPPSFLVDSDGTIVFPLAGTVKVGGLTQVQASQVLAAALSTYLKDPQVTVLVTDSAQYTVSVMGNVVKPGKYLIRGLPTLLGALAEAGGPLPFSALNDTVLIRDNKSTKVPLGIYLDPSQKVHDQPLILPGDLIYVPQSSWPTPAEWGIIASVVSSAAVLAATLYSFRH